MKPNCMKLTRNDQDKIKQCGTKKSYQKGDIIFSEGDKARNMYYIESGELIVEIQKFTIQDEVTLMKEGDCFGEMAFLNGENRSATVVAKTDAELLEVSRDAFLELLSKDKELASRINAIFESRNYELADKENLIDTTHNNGPFYLGIKGDPSLRESAFMRERYESVVDNILPKLQPAIFELLLNRCVYETLIHFNSGEVLVKSIFNPLVDDIYPATKLISMAYINRHFPRVDFDEKIKIAKRMMTYFSNEPALERLDNITRDRLDMTYKSWTPLQPKNLANTISKLSSLRNIPNFYLRNFTISIIRDSIRLQFNCDGTHLLDSESYVTFLKNNLIEEDKLFEVNRRKSDRRNPINDSIHLKIFSDRRIPPGRRQSDWEVLYPSTNN